ncbi:MAG TPA: ParA family protein [Malonomonas sp.]
MARPYVITIASEKGGVGKTTLATNLAIYLKGLAEDLPVTLFSFDNHFTVDQLFALNRKTNSSHVGQIFLGSDPRELTSDGQYGVQYIPSCRQLFELQSHIKGVNQLAEILSRSKLHGLVIIDTSPILDIYTRNALYAADRVIVPIKDAPSLENCQNLARFMREQDLPKSTLRLLPCLIDTRIHFEGPFKNSYQLLKAYAINRGYKCFEGFIAKSPKVESLATNPEGKVYPILTHGRSTDVHLQFMHLARQVYLDYLQQGPLRMNVVANHLYSQENLFDRERRQRTARLHPGCLCCEQPFPEAGIWPGAYFLEDNQGSLSGFIEESCFLDLILKDCYGEQKGRGIEESLRELFVESAERSYLLLQRKLINNDQSQIDFFRLDQSGEKISGRTLLVKERGLFNRQHGSRLLQLFQKNSGSNQPAEQQLLLAHRTGPRPLDIIEHHAYLKWQTVFSRIRVDLAAEVDATEAGMPPSS